MKFTSTRNKKLSVNFAQAVLNCMPADGGLYVPSETEDLRRWLLNVDEDTSFSSIAGTLTSAFINDEFSPIICETIATRAFPFSPEIKQLDENFFLLELNHTPTGNHRDFGISYLTACLDTILQLKGEKAVLVGVSDCGELCASLAWALRGKKNLKAVVICEKNNVRGILESDYVWNGGNIYPVEVDGSEEKCHLLARELFADSEFIREHNITVANTANIGRLLPQAFFYPFAFSRIKNKVHSDIYYALAAGNYSNVVAGLYAWQFALPLNGFILPATNEFAVNPGGNPIILDSLVPLKERTPSDPTEPSNLERLEDVFSANKLMMRHFVFPVDVEDEEINSAAKELFTKYKIFADRHTARAYAAAKIQKSGRDEEYATVLIARDHPSLSSEYVHHIIGEIPEMPDSIRAAKNISKTGKSCVRTSAEIKKIIESL
ncbi:MAG: pyridoxal-phosphate dependent enzyme [Treponema sp.]|nr:pyridoxal-phosphate dependent enzyme [Treponema sp.]